MATVRTDSKHYADIAAAIRLKLGVSTLFTPAQMAEAIGNIEPSEPSTAILPSVVSQTVITNNQYYSAIANAIRMKNGETTLYKPSEMAGAILAIAEQSQKNSYTVDMQAGVNYWFTLGSDGWYINNNMGVDSSAAMSRINLSMATAGKIRLQCINYGEPSWDFGFVSYLDTELSTDWTLRYDDGARKAFNTAEDSSTAIITMEYDVPAGDHFIVVKYKKDGSGSTNGDYFKFKVDFL